MACSRCWGWADYGQATPPANVAFTSLAAGYFHTCGLLADGAPRCWGRDNYGQATPPANVAFFSLAAAIAFFFARRALASFFCTFLKSCSSCSCRRWCSLSSSPCCRVPYPPREASS